MSRSNDAPVGPQGPDGNGLLKFLRDEDVVSTRWKFVGEGNGTFAPVQTYNYVGHGQGSFEKADEPPTACTCRTKAFVALGIVIGLLVLYGLLGMPRPGAVRHPTLLPSDVGWARDPDPALQPSTTQRPAHDCEVGYSSWASSWSDEKKDYCCSIHGRGCPEDETCETVCKYVGKSASCGTRVHYVATHRFLGKQDACSQALDAVQRQCVNCGGCTLAEVTCIAR